MPDDGRELMLAWEIPQEDWEKLTVKTGRYKPGTQELHLLWSALPSEWFLSEVARRFGAGTYKILAGPGPYQKKNTTIHVSIEYARESGYEPAPAMERAPDPAQIMAGRTAQDAVARGIDPVHLAQMLNTAADSAVERALQKFQAQQPQQVSDPSALLLKGFEMAMTMTGRASEVARGLTAPMESDSGGWVGLVKELGPSLLDTLKLAMMSRPAAPAAVPAPAAQPQPRPAIHAAPPVPTGPTVEPQQPFPEPPAATVPILRLMMENKNLLMGALQSQDAASLSQQLAEMLGPALDPAVLATADYVAAYGPGILGHADPAFATPKAAEVFIGWAKIIREDVEGGDEEKNQ